jgi:hypothetical protein
MSLPPPPTNARPAGYLHLTHEFGIRTLPHHAEFYVSNAHTRSEVTVDGFTRRIVPVTQWPGDDVYDHLKFALRYEGLHLGVLRAVVPRLDPVALAASIRAEPTSAYARRLWFLYETLTGTALDLPDLTMGNYVPLAEPEDYYTGPIRRSPRSRVALNLLGDLAFCFIIRRTPELSEADARGFDVACQQLVQDVPPEIFLRALDYLYMKETSSSFAIERETPDQQRAATFVRLLQQSDHQDYFRREALVALQNAIVDSRFANPGGWRDTVQPPEQNFVSGRNAPNIEGIHFIPPRPQEIDVLMRGWLEASRVALQSEAPPVIVAAAIAWSFVFLHPFSDGNGRIHRFLIHHVLARRGFAPRGLVFPVSAAMLDDPRAYDASLEAFSRPLMPLLEWTMDADRHLHVHHDSSEFYRSADYTPMATALYRFVQRTVERDLPNELAFLRGYDAARSAMRAVLDLPDPLADRFIQFCKQNGWRLPKAKRNTGGLEKLTDTEIAALEAAVRTAFGATED